MRLTKTITICVMVIFLLGLFYCAGSADEEMVQASAITTPTVGQNVVHAVEQVIETIPVVEYNDEVIIDAKLLTVYPDNILSEVYDYLYTTCLNNGYHGCTIFDILDEDDYIFLHIVFDDIQYKGVNVDKDPIDVYEVYDCKLTANFIEHWEYN